MTAIAAAALAAAVVTAPPSPVLHTRGDHLTAARGTYCWVSEPDENGIRQGICADTFKPPPVPKGSLLVRRHGRVRVEMKTETESLTATLRGRRGELRVKRVGESKRRFVIRLPRHMKRRPVLDLFGDYPQGDGSFGARLRVRR